MPAPKKIASGKKGTVHVGGAEIDNVAKWALTVDQQNSEHGDNTSEGWSLQSSGTRKAAGTITVWHKEDEALPDLIMGEIYEMELHINDSGADYYSGYFMIKKPGATEADIDQGSEMSQEYEIAAHGKITENGKVPKINEPPAV